MLKLAIRVDANPHIGLGHFFRCLYFAEIVRAHGGQADFFMLASSLTTTVVRFLEQHNLCYFPVSSPGNHWQEDLQTLQDIFTGKGYDIGVVDLLVPDPTDLDLLDNQEYKPANIEKTTSLLRQLGIPTVLFSDQFDRVALRADAIVNTCPRQDIGWYPLSQQESLLLGHRYYILGSAFRRLRTHPKTFDPTPPRIVIFCGGNDQRGFTLLFVEELLKMNRAMELEIILGALTQKTAAMLQNLAGTGARVHCLPPDVSEILFAADFVFSAAGNTLFDLAALGIPSAAAATRERQAITAGFFAEHECSVSLGLNEIDIRKNIQKKIAAIIFDCKKLQQMSANGRALVDGLGGERIFNHCREILERKHHEHTH